MSKTAIEWTDRTWNPVVGCSRVSPGCDNCYAMHRAREIELSNPSGIYAGTTRDTSHGTDWTGKVVPVPSRLNQPLGWRKPSMVFVNSMSDLFHPSLTFDYIEQVWEIMGRAPQHVFQVLTKRPEIASKFLWWRSRIMGRSGKPLPNVWLGTSVESQEVAEKRIPALMTCPNALPWLSMEPLLSPVNITRWLRPTYPTTDQDFIEWVVVGGESGKAARPFYIEWAKGLIEQCRKHGTPVFIKQVGAKPRDSRGPLTVFDAKGGNPHEWPEDIRRREWPPEYYEDRRAQMERTGDLFDNLGKR